VRSDGRAAAAAGAGPDEHRALGLADRALIQLVQNRRALAPRRLHPEVDDRRALLERHVTEDGDRLRVGDRRKRRADARMG